MAHWKERLKIYRKTCFKVLKFFAIFTTHQGLQSKSSQSHPRTCPPFFWKTPCQSQSQRVKPNQREKSFQLMHFRWGRKLNFPKKIATKNALRGRGRSSNLWKPNLLTRKKRCGNKELRWQRSLLSEMQRGRWRRWIRSSKKGKKTINPRADAPTQVLKYSQTCSRSSKKITRKRKTARMPRLQANPTKEQTMRKLLLVLHQKSTDFDNFN